ncbi:PREDICTED: SLP adapter and CSK-interacting membrane protein isoform X1 [Capra hircus]|uniref:SLP adapter and CSK-interacting membrane protein isoform X1 n=2 Tax=Capra hircus TaxID=9925 RepID=UPI0003AFB003|nr:PREDICTED: SLP adapter and CSK-interacting membrane protein isoform X1 [Capra hircus]XP_013827510.1 PREDICTED: SLP adapter and CSK-interacting membrane protein isoform X1 [Capra hircus]
MAPQLLTSGPPATQDPEAMDWLKDHFWIILAVAIIFTSVSLGTILFFVCRCLFRQGNKWEISKSLKQKQRDEETMYENVTEQFSVQLPPLPPRDMLSPEVASPQETPSRPTPAAYSSVHKIRNKKTITAPSYIEPEEDYDDVDVPANTENHHLKSNISSFWQAEDGSQSLF